MMDMEIINERRRSPLLSFSCERKPDAVYGPWGLDVNNSDKRMNNIDLQASFLFQSGE